MNKRFKYSIILTGILLLGIIALCITSYISGVGKDVVNIVAAPEDTVLILDDTTTLKPGHHKLKTGTHTIKASRQDFYDQTKEFTTTSGRDNAVWFVMEPSTSAGIEYLDTHQADFEKVYEIANSQVVDDINTKTANYPIIKSLPASAQGLYVINYQQSKKHPNDSSKLALYITADYPVGRLSAIEYIYSLGFDPSDYEIVFETSQASSIDEGSGIGDYYQKVQDSAEEDAQDE